MGPLSAFTLTASVILFLTIDCVICIEVAQSRSRGDNAAFDETALINFPAVGNFAAARSFALELHRSEGDSKIAKMYQHHADLWLVKNFSNYLEPDYENILSMDWVADNKRPMLDRSGDDKKSCWSWIADNQNNHADSLGGFIFEKNAASFDPVALWDSCCSQLSPINNHNTSVVLESSLPEAECIRNSAAFCCNFGPATSSFLRLPALLELALRMDFPMESYSESPSTNPSKSSNSTSVTFEIQQDGFLRMFNPSTVLWPTAYLLGLCLAAPNRCGVPELWNVFQNSDNRNYLELGAGVGLPSAVLARQLASMDQSNSNEPSAPSRILTADISLAALVLTITNAAMSIPGDLATNLSIIPVQLNHSDATAVSEFARRHGRMKLIIGSSLQDVFDDSTLDPQHVLWQTLDTLLDQDTGWVLLAHSVESLQIPPATDFVFKHVRTVSGLVFGMTTRWNAQTSDFAISIFRRKSHPRQPPITDNEPEL